MGKIMSKIKRILFYIVVPFAVIIFVIHIIFNLFLNKAGIEKKLKRRKMIKELNKEAEEALKNNENTQEFIKNRFDSYMSSFNKFKSRL
jgi:ABC-type multidrug transport system fused ATPase/permease subunit